MPLYQHIPRDANGNLVANVAPRSVYMPVGDSYLDMSFNNPGNASAVTNNGDGTATATIGASAVGSTWQIFPGDYVYVNNHSTPQFNQLRALVTAVNTSGNNFTYSLAGPYSSMVGSGTTATIRHPWAFACQGPLSWLEAWSQGQLRMAYPAVQGGCRLAHALANYNALAPLYPHQFAVICAGRNDIYLDDMTLANFKVAMASLLESVTRRGVIPIVLGIPVQATDNGVWSAGKYIVHVSVNRWLAQYVPSIGGRYVSVEGAHSNGVSFVDTAQADGDPTTLATWLQADKTHFTWLSSFAVGRAIWNAMSGLVRPVTLGAWGAGYINANDATIINDNCALTGTTGTADGSYTKTHDVPTGLAYTASGSATVVHTVTARTIANDGDTFGNWSDLAITSTSGATTLTGTIALTAARVSVGDTIRGSLQVKIAADPAAIIGMSFDVLMQQSTTNWKVLRSSGGTSTAITEGGTFTFATPWHTVNSAAGAVSNLSARIQIFMSGAGTPTVSIAHPLIEKSPA